MVRDWIYVLRGTSAHAIVSYIISPSARTPQYWRLCLNLNCWSYIVRMCAPPDTAMHALQTTWLYLPPYMSLELYTIYRDLAICFNAVAIITLADDMQYYQYIALYWHIRCWHFSDTGRIELKQDRNLPSIVHVQCTFLHRAAIYRDIAIQERGNISACWYYKLPSTSIHVYIVILEIYRVWWWLWMS